MDNGYCFHNARNWLNDKLAGLSTYRCGAGLFELTPNGQGRSELNGCDCDIKFVHHSENNNTKIQNIIWKFCTRILIQISYMNFIEEFQINIEIFQRIVIQISYMNFIKECRK